MTALLWRLLLLSWATGIGFVVVTYFVAFALLGTGKRSIVNIVRSFLSELWAMVVLLPAWPFTFLVGARYEPAHSERARRPVILLHGFGMNRTNWLLLGRRLAKSGLGPLYGFSYFSLQSIRDSAAELKRFIDGVKAREGVDRVDIIAHSMGGLVARVCIERMEAADDVANLITLGTPHAGTSHARLAFVPGGRELMRGSALLGELATSELKSGNLTYTSIWSRSDAMVVPPESASLGALGTDVVFEDLGHLALLMSKRVIAVVVERLS